MALDTIQNVKRTLFLLSVIDLVLGIVSMCLQPLEWQISALIASLMTFCCLLVLLIGDRHEVKRNITTLLLGIVDIAFGALSICLMLYTFKALVVTVSALKSFKIGKVAVQGSKALKLSKSTSPIVKKVAIRTVPLVVSFIRKILKCRGNKMGDNNASAVKKSYNFGAFLKNNWQTIVGIICAIYCVLEGEFHWIGNALAGVHIDPHIAYAILSPLYGFIANALVKHGIEFGKSKQVRELAKVIGVEDAYTDLQNAYVAAQQAAEAEKIEAEAKAKAEAEKAEIKALVEEENAKAEAEQRAQANRLKAQEIRRKYLNDVAVGAFVGDFNEWFENYYSAN